MSLCTPVCTQETSKQSNTVEAHLRLKVDARRGDHMVRGAAVLPHSWQQGLRIAVFAEGAAADEARAAGGQGGGGSSLALVLLTRKDSRGDCNRNSRLSWSGGFLEGCRLL